MNKVVLKVFLVTERKLIESEKAKKSGVTDYFLFLFSLYFILCIVNVGKLVLSSKTRTQVPANLKKSR